ncbi:BatA domain-containing protein [Mariniblastus fucicola]|uniref:VWFA domain-containing protein n=1 Tax=Mariniblastus fucicola TaxID=980251 RepID=A0A5B9PA06_9BACT|nr:BatA domain-containing protein [Mariniblastus fucicola]QEG23597.1 hypothetical protein MFFC18_34980 [Mariniblastus fucicola]
MSALAWLFGLGFLALAGPLLFHLIRRTPKGEIPFSSLMFLRATPPTLTRRSRLDNLLLLALRMAAVALIAAAFMRPFFNNNVKLDFADVPGRKTAVLIDTSASMKRADLWAQATKKLKSVVDEAEANDEIAVFTFDSKLEKRVGYLKKSDAANLLQQFESLQIQPGWNQSKLGDALVGIANRLLESQSTPDDEDESSEVSLSDSKLQVVVISDMQTGSSTSALQSFRWPEQIKVRFDPVATDLGTNATLELLPVDENDPEQIRENVLVRNSKGSTSDQFSVSWENSSLPATPFLVPAGSSKILRVARDANSLSSDKLMLTGDDAEYDNQFFAIPPLSQTVNIRYVGDESENDPEGMLFYFKRSLIETPAVSYEVAQQRTTSESNEPGMDPEFIVISRAVSTEETESIDKLLKRGVTLFVVLSDPAMLDSTRTWTGVASMEEASEPDKDDYAMLGSIDFSHPVFAPFSGPRFNDFTEIRFWDFIRPNLADNVQVLARFDNDTPALWHQMAHDKSDIYVLGTGWQPEKSQLALSSKFLPLMMRMIELATKTEPVAANNIVGDSIKPPLGYDRLVWPDGKVEFLEGSSTQTLNLPGVYAFNSSSDSTLADVRVAVNVDPAESQINTMPVDQISALGVEVGTHDTSQEEVERQRQLRDVELENRQKLWKWLVLGAIGLIIAESWLAGRTDRTSRNFESAEQGTANE